MLEFYANAHISEKYKDSQSKFTSYVRGKEVSFHAREINAILDTPDVKNCAYHTRRSCPADYDDLVSTCCRPEATWKDVSDETPYSFKNTYMHPLGRAWGSFVH